MASDDNTETKAALKSLKFKRGQIKGRVTRIKTFLESFDPTTQSVSNIKCRLEKLEDCWSEFNAVHAELINLSDTDDSLEDEYITFEDNYFEIRSKIEDFLSPNEPLTQTNLSQASLQQTNSHDNIQLPNIPLPTFSGKYEEWTDFHDVFVSMIHNSTKLCKIQKFYYLRSCLSDDALRTIKEIKVTNDNYDSAWATLKGRFTNKRLIIKAHVQGILNYRSLDKPRANELKNLHDTITNHLTALNNLGEPTEQWSTLLVFLISQKLDRETRDRWESYQAKLGVNDETEGSNSATLLEVSKDVSNKSSSIYSFKLFMRFLYEQCVIQEVREEDHAPYNNNKVKKPFIKTTQNNVQFSKPFNKTLCHAVNTFRRTCALCKKDHPTFTCEQLTSCSSPQRYERVKKHDLCINCLRAGHKTIQCKSPYNCKYCNKRHHTILHNTNSSPLTEEKASETLSPSTSSSTSSQNSTVVGCSSNNEEVMLATAVISIADSQGKFYPCRVLLDSGSQSNFISSSLASALGLRQSKVSTNVSGIASTGISTNTAVNTVIRSRLNDYSESIEFLVLRKITNNLPTSSVRSKLEIPTDIKLADEEFFESRGIDALLGANVFYDILQDGRVKLGNDLPILQNTVFGWVIGGKISSQKPLNRTYSFLTIVDSNSQLSTDQLIQSFWQLEEGVNKPKTIQNHICESHFLNNVKRQPDGKFVVKLPFSSEPESALGKSMDQAFKRFLSLERKLLNNPTLRQDYISFLNEYLENDELELLHSDDEHGYYLPHHPVVKESSSSTRVRVVFDASAKSTSGNSLNDILMIGPTIQRDLISILLSFRMHTYVFTTDIKQMYRKILINEDQRKYQKILWRNDVSEPIQSYRLNTVTYGTASAPFLAIRSLFHLAEIERNNFPAAAEVLQKDFYVDDCLTGSDSLENLKQLQEELINILKSAGFELRKWCANHPSLLQSIPVEHTETNFILDSESKTIKTLGIFWNPITDTFHFNVKLFKPPDIITKRIILSDISRIFDPIGLLSPVVIAAKLLMQNIWTIKDLGWDQPVPEDIKVKWYSYRESLTSLNQLSIDRRILGKGKTIEIHGFSDASEKAYGACLYLRTINMDESITVKLFCSKSRVAPIKSVSLPRLELCGALLLAQLLRKLRDSLNLNFQSITLWTDSTIVLHWLNSPANTWQTFVSNRVAQIHELTNDCIWNHVRSKDNPADLISRSAKPEVIISSSLWWHGPHWLTKTKDQWPEALQIISVNPDLEERKRNIITTMTTISTPDLLEKVSSWSKLLRITALCLRFIHNCKNSKSRIIGHLVTQDLRKAELVWIKHAQGAFSEDFKNIRSGKVATNKIKSLNPFIDVDNILRVGGRLKNALIDPNYKNPILLPYDHIITKLIFTETHINTLHAGPQALLSTIRTKYWPLNGKILARSTVRKCFKCFRVSPKPTQHLMGDLPPYRVQPSHPFQNCGVDFCGPFYYRKMSLRRSLPAKAYAALFICMASKAIHIELVPDLTTKKFLEALQRLLARRGAIKNIFSDNATNFVGAKNELLELKNLFLSDNHQYQLHKYCASTDITWHFIPPRSPHFGGLWEAGVKSVKSHLKRVLGNQILMYDELETLFVKIEACVNSRPLTALSTDPNDLNPLTPAHFITGQQLASFPVPDMTDININRLDHWKKIQNLHQTFWRRWSNEYLSTLQQRKKWQKNFKPPKVGSLAVIKEDFRPPLHWHMGRIEEIHCGTDGIPRVATVRTSKGLFKRALVKLCVLPED